ncbi:HD domain-containing phosphohydrolase [Grimontia sp. NTOU-MAR1]|uniref:HD domain-containing phosphohydrolase n=1 Tax=Grimontia sp. NTOU-MAR1 TaxID=3111011 RepID=UPI002DBDFD4F|nr:HD domain-containing phosphohydrolase [Grimontia sp. NTOU-MAR1]WRV98956.1 HD domain-containing phosphohydrolase [Grimontia sp. NTOU-MAR1]
MAKRRYTLQIHIAGIFFIVVSLLSALLIVLSYQNSKELNQQLAAERTAQNAERIKLSFQKLTSPVVTAMDALANSDFGHSLYASYDDGWLSSINAILERNPDVLSVYVGYPNESSAFIRSTKLDFMKEQFSTPENSHIMVDINSKVGHQIRTHYDGNLKTIRIDTDLISYKPTQRPWYKAAPEDGSIHVTDPYFYLFIQRMGITLTRKFAKINGVLAVDITLDSLNKFLYSLVDTEETQLMLLDDHKSVFAHTGFLPDSSSGMNQRMYLEAMSASPFNHLFKTSDWEESNTTIHHNGEKWALNLVRISFGGERGLWLAKTIPERLMIKSALEARNNQITISMFGLLIGTFMVLWASKRIANPLKVLVDETQKIRRLDFSSVSTPTSKIVEVRELSESVHMMSETIQNFLQTLHRVSNSSNFDSLMADIALHCQQTSGADYVMLWTHSSESHDKLTLTAQYPCQTEANQIDLLKLLADSPDMEKALQGQHFLSFKPSSSDIERGLLPDSLKHAWLVPLYNRDKDCVGYVLMGFNGCPGNDQDDKLQFIRQFLGFASLIKENWDRVAAQKQLFKSFIEMMASAIDTKSPYTGGHCQRVPELTFMLAEAASKDKKRFPDFTLNEQSREALYFAAWLHDCGKVTTPEFVVDKATKLETIYNRIHEVRTRFEVLKRDAEITYWQKRLEGQSSEILDAWLAEEHKTLDEEFAFIAKCNVGGEFMDKSNIAKLEKIAERSWMRTIDDIQGLSWEEEARRSARGSLMLPCKEYVLSDTVDQKIPWLPQQLNTFKDWEFKLPVPQLQYNRGELYNLSIQRGTLTEEERFIINDHIIQTINMLRKLPYPKHLERVPEIAGGHHEKLDGKGYPYGLDESSLSVDARIMAVADIFEALTASDRPYKKAKTLSEALKILAFMAKDKHIDEQLFRLFIEEKIYIHYAEQYLPIEQHDEVNEEALMAIITPKPEKETETA